MLCPTKYYQKDVVVADIIATDAPYFADPTGKTDSTAAIQAALNACLQVFFRFAYKTCCPCHLAFGSVPYNPCCIIRITLTSH